MMMKKLFALALALTATAAQAEWKEASSTHFVVYGEGGDETVRDSAEKLEKFYHVLGVLTGLKDVPAARKVKVYLFRTTEEVQDTLPVPAGGVAGYYSTTIRGPFAVMPRMKTGGEFGLKAQQVLFHELTHHFMFQYFPVAYPTWYQEGFADFTGTIDIQKNDVVSLGGIVENRFLVLRNRNWLPLDKLLTAQSYFDVGENVLSLYSEGWLLVHYLKMHPGREGQLEKYLNGIASGMSYKDAMNAAFGPGAKQLDEELRAYSHLTKYPALDLPFKKMDTGPIAVRSLSPAEDALIRYDISISSGILKTKVARFAQDVKAAAERFPNDPYALKIETEALRLAGDTAGATAAADRWLAVRPGDALAMMEKGALQVDALAAAHSRDAASWNAARQLILEANRKAPREPQIMEAYYDSFAKAGELPPAGAQNALFKALELLPKDNELRYRVALDFERRGMIEEAIAVIKPTAFEAHNPDQDDPKKREEREKLEERYRRAGTEKHENARQMLTRLEQKLKQGGSKPS
jgi:tetratricopeptide (TPR) repeat protein